jgi:hypothetical protein
VFVCFTELDEIFRRMREQFRAKRLFPTHGERAFENIKTFKRDTARKWEKNFLHR